MVVLVFGIITTHRSGSGKTVILNFVKSSVEYFNDAIHLKCISSSMLKDFDIADMKSLIIEGATIPAIEKDLSTRTGCNDSKEIITGKKITAGNGVKFSTEAWSFVKDNSGPGKHKIGSFLCEVSILVVEKQMLLL